CAPPALHASVVQRLAECMMARASSDCAGARTVSVAPEFQLDLLPAAVPRSTRRRAARAVAPEESGDSMQWPSRAVDCGAVDGLVARLGHGAVAWRLRSRGEHTTIGHSSLVRERLC